MCVVFDVIYSQYTCLQYWKTTALREMFYICALLLVLLFLQGEYTLPQVPLLIMGVLGILAGLAVFLLPETLGQKLPDTVEEAEIRARN
jgi:hypothetical protein